MAATAVVLYAAMFLVVFVLRTLLQKRATGDSGIRAGVLGADPWSLEWWAGWLLVASMLALLAAPIAEMLGLDPLTGSAWVRWTGMGVVGLGIVLTLLSQLSMGAEWRIGIDTNERTGLVTGGAFGFVRNPIFSAMILTGSGFVLLVPNPISIAGLILLTAAIEIQVRRVEEPHLRRLHGDPYGRYCAHVGRFLPGIGRLGSGR